MRGTGTVAMGGGGVFPFSIERGVCHLEKVTFGQRSEGGEAGSQLDLWGMSRLCQADGPGTPLSRSRVRS